MEKGIFFYSFFYDIYDGRLYDKIYFIENIFYEWFYDYF